MSDIEDRLRAELWAQAQRTQAEDLRELRVPPRREPAGARRRGRGRGRYWLAPVAAALAVIGVIVGVQLSVPRPAAPPAAPPVPHGQPRYYLEIPDGGGDIDEPSITVRRTADAAAVGQVSVPGVILGDVATVNDRTFILAGWRKPAGTKPDVFYRLTLSGSGHVRRLQKLDLKGLRVPVGPHGYSAGSLALAPDGQTLAFAVNPSGEENEVVTGHARIEVVSLRTGAVRTWTAPALYYLSELSWGRGTQSLQFLSVYQRIGGPYTNTLRRLDLSRPGASVLGASRPVPIPASAGRVTSALAVDNGRVVLAWTSKPDDAAHHPADSVLSEFSARTGRRLRMLMTVHSLGTFAGFGELWSADPSGQHLIIGGTEITGLQKGSYKVKTPGGTEQVIPTLNPVTRMLFGRLDDGRYTPLPDRPAPGRPARQDQAGAW
jgi:hypothetical protein